MTETRERTDQAVPTSVTSQRSFRLDIQGLRGVAVLSVVLYHCGLRFVSGGYAGVDVFFVISGFLITSHLFGEVQRTGRISLTKFYSRRARRLLIPAVFVIAVTVVLAWLFGPPLSAADTAKDGAYASVYFINYHLAALAVDYQHAGDTASPLQHYWSLAVEEQFYLLWPLLILIAVLIFRRFNRRAVVGTLVAVIGVWSLTLSIMWTPHEASYSYFSLQTRAWQLAVGAAIAIALPVLRNVPALAATIATWCGLGMILFSVVVYDDNTPFPGYLALVPVLGAAFIIAGGVVDRPAGAQAALRHEPLQFLGRVSYAWYLWHWPAVILGPSILNRHVDSLGKIGLCLVALVAAWLTSILLEQPLLRTALRPSRWLPAAALASACALGVSLLAYATPALHITGPAAAQVRLGADPSSTLHTLLTQAVKAKAVPRNLTPGLLNAQSDGRNPCLTQLTQTGVQRCTFGNPSAAHTMVLFGDSHADEWTPLMKQMAIEEGWRLVVLTRVGCPLANFLIYTPQIHRNYTECSQWRTGRLAEIAQLHPDLVVVSQSNTIGETAYTSQQWAEGTRQTMAKLVAASRRVVYLGDTPHPPSSVPACLADHLSSRSACNFADPTLPGSHAVNSVQSRRDPDLRSVVQSVGGTYLATASWFCVGGVCPAIVGNVLIYRDDSHISSSAARMMEPLLKPELFPAAA